jgi:bifunctional DNA-binding transcriptional regulator/antitoxin component of YhaV-PrlF toxin-antitoxin module
MDIETEKTTSKGQVTIPLKIERIWEFCPVDSVAFVQDGEKVYLVKGTLEALAHLQNLFAGKAEKAGLKTEDDVVRFSKAVRSELAHKNLNIAVDTNVLLSSLLLRSPTVTICLTSSV